MQEKIRRKVLAAIAERGMNVFNFAKSLGAKASTAEKWLYCVENNPKFNTVEAILKKLGMELSI